MIKNVPTLKKRERKTNWGIVARNLAESRDQIVQTLEQIKSKKVSDGYIQVQIEHALHHLYFGWNARKATLKEYRNLTSKDFNDWSKVPKDLEVARVPIRKNK